MIAGDIRVQGYLETIYLHEIPLSEYLDEQMAIDNAVLSYSFFGFDLDQICELQECTFLGSGSSSAQDSQNLHIFLYSAPDNYLESTYDYFYKPTEVSNATSYTKPDDWWSKPNVFDALYAYDSNARPSRDEFNLVSSL